jgi:hypothetical protein
MLSWPRPPQRLGELRRLQEMFHCALTASTGRPAIVACTPPNILRPREAGEVLKTERKPFSSLASSTPCQAFSSTPAGQSSLFIGSTPLGPAVPFVAPSAPHPFTLHPGRQVSGQDLIDGLPIMARNNSIDNARNETNNAQKDAVEQDGGPLHFPAGDELEQDKAMQQTIINARNATEKEHKMTLMQGVRLYPKAIAWSLLISTCIAMEGYDVCLINNFYA